MFFWKQQKNITVVYSIWMFMCFYLFFVYEYLTYTGIKIVVNTKHLINFGLMQFMKGKYIILLDA